MSRPKEVPVIGMKNVYSLKSLSDAKELYFIFILTFEVNTVQINMFLKLLQEFRCRFLLLFGIQY